MGKASREKGKRGEREVAKLLQDIGFDAHRAQQYCGRTGQADDVVGVDGFHIEVKRCEQIRIMEWLHQAESDSTDTDDIPVVVFRKNKEVWYAALPAIDFFQILHELQGSRVRHLSERGMEQKRVRNDGLREDERGCP